MGNYFTLQKKKSFAFGKIMLIAGGIAMAAGVLYSCTKAVGYTAAAIHQSTEIVYPQYEPPQVLPQTLEEMIGTTIEMPHGLKLYVTQDNVSTGDGLSKYLQKYGVKHEP